MQFKILVDYDNIYKHCMLNGVIEVICNEILYIKQFVVEVVGIAECEWRVEKHFIKGCRVYKRGTKFYGKEQFFISRHSIPIPIDDVSADALKTSGSQTEIMILQPGNQSFHFKCKLINGLPATWTGKFGTIKYLAKILIKKEKHPTQVHEEEIIFVAHRNLKLEPHLLCEARTDVKRTYRFTILDLGTVEVSIWLPLCGVAAGQFLPLLCTVINHSSIRFGGIIFVLTRIEIYRSTKPTAAVKTHRKDICRIPRMVDILTGKYEYYCVLETTPDTLPTNQFWRCKSCQVIYEVWISVQGIIPPYNGYGYPNIDTPGIPVIIGSDPICVWNAQEITATVLAKLYESKPPVIMESLPPDDEVKELINNADEELDEDTIRNLSRQLESSDLPSFDHESEDEDEPEDD